MSDYFTILEQKLKPLKKGDTVMYWIQGSLENPLKSSNKASGIKNKKLDF